MYMYTEVNIQLGGAGRDPSIESVSMGRSTFFLLLPLAFLLLLLLLSTNQSGKKDVPRVFVARLPNRSNNSPILVYNKVSAAFLRFNRSAGEQVRLVHPPAADEEVEGGQQVCFVFYFCSKLIFKLN